MVKPFMMKRVMTIDTHAPDSVAAIDWSAWKPIDPATLVFVFRAREVLLIRKKRGLGAGKINAPGGRIEAGESPLCCAIRETQEEVGITPTGLREIGVNSFQFVDGYGIHVHVFTATGFEGEIIETDEAIPMWTPTDAIPYEEMWEDDHIWVPHLLAGRTFVGRFLFDGDRMVDQMVEVGEDPITPDRPRSDGSDQPDSL